MNIQIPASQLTFSESTMNKNMQNYPNNSHQNKQLLHSHSHSHPHLHLHLHQHSLLLLNNQNNTTKQQLITKHKFHFFAYGQKNLKYLFILLTIIIQTQITSSWTYTTNPLLLTNSTNQHTNNIEVLKFSGDHKTIYSIDGGAIMKIWDFNLTSISLRQTISVGGGFNFNMASAFFVWNGGLKIFVGGMAASVNIYNLNSATNTYVFDTTISVGTWVYSIWVNTNCTRIFVATISVIRIELIGGTWTINTPSYFPTILGTGGCSHVFVSSLSNQQKIISLCAYTPLQILKLVGSNYVLHQNLSASGFISQKNCFISSNQQYLNCYGNSSVGGSSQFHIYRYNPSTDLYDDITQANTILTSVINDFSYMNKLQVYTMINNDNNSIIKYKYNRNSTGTPRYSYLNHFLFPNQSLHRIAFQSETSEFEIVSTVSGNIYLLTPYCNNTVTLDNCYNCFPNNSICVECNEGFALVSGNCENCLLGYYLNGSICFPCGINCQNCSDNLTCTICLIGWALNGTICNICATRYIYNGSTCIPDPCIPNCAACLTVANLTTCLGCIDGYSYYASADSCCSHGTNACNPNGTSSTCRVGFGIINSTCNCSQINFVVSSDNQSCVCLPPYQEYGGVCDNFIDRRLINCLNAQRLANGTPICLFCPKHLNQILLNHYCYCGIGYHDPNYTGLCSQICGDGLAFESDCDDSNVLSGDGCNQFCQEQPGFQCSKINTSSICKSQTLLRYSSDVKIIRNDNDNQAVLVLKLLNNRHNTPYAVEYMNFKPQGYFLSIYIIKSQNPYQEVKIDNLTLNFIDSNYSLYLKARIELNYENSLYFNYTQKIDFIMKGSNKGLIYSEYLGMFKSLSTANLIITILSGIILFIGLLTPKFIGLQMILTLQLIFFSQILISDLSKWPLGFMFLKHLKLATGYNDILDYQFYLPKQKQLSKFYNLDMKIYILQNLNLNFIIFFLGFLIALLLLIKRFYEQKKISCLKQSFKKETNRQTKQQLGKNVKQSSAKILKEYYLNQKSFHIVSHISYWSILPFMATLSAFFFIKNKYQEQKLSLQYNQAYLVIEKLMCILNPLMIIVCLNNFKNLWLPSKNWEYLQRKEELTTYKSVLFLYLIVMGNLILFFNKVKFSNIPISIIILLLQIIFILILTKINPYRQCLRVHSIALFTNHIVYLVFLIILNLINFIQNLNEVVILGMGCFVTLACIGLIVLSVIRLYYQYRYGQQLEMRLQKQREQKQALQKLKQKEKLERKKKKFEKDANDKLNEHLKIRAENMYIIENQIMEDNEFEILNWLQNRNWTQQRKQEYYFNKYHQKPLAWLKQHDIPKYDKRLKEIMEKKANKDILKSQRNQDQKTINLNLTLKLSSYQRQSRDKQKQVINHKKLMKRDPQYNMNIMRRDIHKLVQKQYQLKD